MIYKERLAQHVKDIQTDLDKERSDNRHKRELNRERRAFEKLPEFTTRMEFWCERCEVDFVAPTYKVWSEIYEVGSWHSYCPICGLLVYRHITAKKIDPYYFRSEKIRVMTGEMKQDLLQPGEFGFKSNYGDPFEHYYNRFQLRHEELFNKYASMGLIGKTIEQKTDEELISV